MKGPSPVSFLASISIIAAIIAVAVFSGGCEGTPQNVESPKITDELTIPAQEPDYRQTLLTEPDCPLTPDIPEYVTINGKKYSTQLTDLSLYGEGFSDISQLQYFTNLEFLSLRSNGITDISPLASLKELIYLDLGSNAISDISPLENLRKLRYLLLSDNSISDISPLKNLMRLEKLELGGNYIRSVSALKDHASLLVLELYKNKIADVGPLAGLINLEELHLNGNLILNIESISNLTRLTELDISKNLITDISSLKNLVELKFLFISSNNIADLSPVCNLKDLTVLWADDCGISDITPIMDLSNLAALHLEGNSISDISPLSALTNLELDNVGLDNNPYIEKLLCDRFGETAIIVRHTNKDASRNFRTDGYSIYSHYENYSVEYTEILSDEYDATYPITVWINPKNGECIIEQRWIYTDTGNFSSYNEVKTAFEQSIQDAGDALDSEVHHMSYYWEIPEYFGEMLRYRESLEEVNEDMGRNLSDKYGFHVWITINADFIIGSIHYRVLSIDSWGIPYARMYIQIFDDNSVNVRFLDELVHEGATYDQLIYCELFDDPIGSNIIAVLRTENDASGLIGYIIKNYIIDGRAVYNKTAIKNSYSDEIWDVKGEEYEIDIEYTAESPQYLYYTNPDSTVLYENGILTITLVNADENELHMQFINGLWEVASP